MNNVAVILAAAGKSSRFASAPQDPASKKPFAMLRGKSVWLYSAETFYQRKEVIQLLITISPEDKEWFQERYAEEIERFSLTVVSGGKERVDSVGNALAALRNDVEFVAVHDAARPCVSAALIENTFQAAAEHEACVPAAPVAGTLKRVENGTVLATVPRETLWEAQTPQVFRRNILTDSFSRRGTFVPTDDAQLAEHAGYPVHVIASNRWNIKITEQTDLLLAERILEVMPLLKGI